MNVQIGNTDTCGHGKAKNNSPALQPTPQEWVIRATFLLLQSIELGVAYAPKHSENPVPHFPMTSRLQNGKSLDFPQYMESISFKKYILDGVYCSPVQTRLRLSAQTKQDQSIKHVGRTHDGTQHSTLFTTTKKAGTAKPIARHPPQRSSL